MSSRKFTNKRRKLDEEPSEHAPGDLVDETETVEYWKNQCNLLQIKNDALEAQLSSTNLSCTKVRKRFGITDCDIHEGIPLPQIEIRRNSGRSASNNEEAGGRVPFDIIPELAWKTIFDKLKDPNDRFRCSRAVKGFDTILSPTKAEWLFEQILPLIFDQLGQRDLWKSRLVCKDWAHAVDFAFQNYPAWRVHNPKSDFQKKFDPETGNLGRWLLVNLPGCISLTKESRIQRFTEMAQECDPGRNPIPSRTLTLNLLGRLNLSEDDNVDDFLNNVQPWRRMMNLLDACGMEVWNLTIGVFARDYPQFQKRLKKCLGKLPNLRYLSLHAGIVEYGRISWREMKTDLPSLPHLEVLDLTKLNFREKVSAGVPLGLLAKYGPVVKKLLIESNFGSSYLKKAINMPQLTHLHLRVRSMREFQSLINQVKGKLWKLSLDVDPDQFKLTRNFLQEMRRLGVEVLELISGVQVHYAYQLLIAANHLSKKDTTDPALVVSSLHSLICYQSAVRISGEVFKIFPALRSIYHRNRETFGKLPNLRNASAEGKVMRFTKNSSIKLKEGDSYDGPSIWEYRPLAPSLKEITVQENNVTGNVGHVEIDTTTSLRIGCTFASNYDSSSSSSSSSDSDSTGSNFNSSPEDSQSM